MDFALNEGQQILKKSARDFLAQECPLGPARQAAEKDAGFSSRIWKKMAELGWLGIMIPEEHGGGGGSFMDLSVLVAEMGRAIAPVPFIAHSLSAFMIMHVGTEEQKKSLLPDLSAGKRLTVPAFYEDGFGRPGSPVRCSAVLESGGYVINGAKAFVPYADAAHFVIVPAITNGSGSRITLLLVDIHSDGVSRKKQDNISDEGLFDVKLKGVKAPVTSQLGNDGKASQCLSDAMEKGALLRCAEMVGAAERILEVTVEYAKTRVQFGQPIGKFQAIQHHIANMSVDLDTSRLIANRAIWMASEGISCTKEAGMAKSWVSDAYRRICSLSHQTHGGVGLIIDHDLPLYTKRSFGAEAEFGDADFQREVVAQRIGL